MHQLVCYNLSRINKLFSRFENTSVITKSNKQLMVVGYSVVQVGQHFFSDAFPGVHIRRRTLYLIRSFQKNVLCKFLGTRMCDFNFKLMLLYLCHMV